MENVLKVLAPKECLTAKLTNPDTNGIREDGRTLDEFREISYNMNVLKNRPCRRIAKGKK